MMLGGGPKRAGQGVTITRSGGLSLRPVVAFHLGYLGSHCGQYVEYVGTGCQYRFFLVEPCLHRGMKIGINSLSQKITSLGKEFRHVNFPGHARNLVKTNAHPQDVRVHHFKRVAWKIMK